MSRTSYHMAMKIGKEDWFVCKEAFLMTNTDNKIIGQYITSLWMNVLLKSKYYESDVYMAIVQRHFDSNYSIQEYEQILNNNNTDLYGLNIVKTYGKINRKKLKDTIHMHFEKLQNESAGSSVSSYIETKNISIRITSVFQDIYKHSHIHESDMIYEKDGIPRFMLTTTFNCPSFAF